MGMIIQITEEKIDEMSEAVDDMLHIGGRLMSCIESMKTKGGDGSEMGYRRGRMNYRDEQRYDRDKWSDDDMNWRNQRRGSDGRYM